MNAEAVLAQGLQDLGLTLEPERLQRLLAHMDLLLKWNRVYNLTAVRDPGEMLTHHLLDCLSVLPPLMRYTRGQALRVLDVGSGGGLPGAVLAICRPELDVTCVDTVAKKAAFIQQVAGTLGVSNLHSTHARVESLSATWPLVISRAFASLADFTLWSSAALSPGGVWLAMKGKNPQAEITELPPPVQVFHVEPLVVPGLAAERCLVWMGRAEASN